MAKKHWIQGAIKRPGAFKAKAKKAGETTHEFAEAHKGDSGRTGAQARLALTLMGMHHKKKSNHESDRRKAFYGD